MKLFNLTLATLVLLSLSNTTFSQSSNPELVEQGTTHLLSIPLVDYAGVPGLYQNAIFERQKSDGSWKLLSVHSGVAVQFVTAADVIATTDRPVQIFVKIRGLIGACERLGEHGIAKIGNAFTIYLYYSTTPPDPNGCIQEIAPYTRIVPLPVYGLGAGEYTFSVNGAVNGNFSLAQDNTIP